MDPLTMALLAGGMSFGQGLMGARGEKKQRRRYGRRLKRALGATESIQGNALQQQEALSRLATQQQLGGYDTARKETARLGRSAKRSALDRETQLMGRASQSMANRGLGSTTMGANLQRGIASDTNRSMADVDEGMASLFGNLALGRAGVEAQGTQNLSQIAGQRGDLMSQLAQMGIMRDMYSSSPWGGSNPMQTRQGLGSSLMGGLSTGVGAFLGAGGQGGAGGGQMPFDPQEFMMYLYDQQQNGLGHY